MSPAKVFMYDKPNGLLKWRGKTNIPFAPVVTPPATSVTASVENTGVPSGTTLTTSGSTYLSTASAVYDGVHFTGALVQIVGNNQSFTNCKFTGEVVILGDNVILNRCEAAAFSFSGAWGTRGTGLRAFGGIGKDNFHVTSDTGQSGNIELRRLYARGTVAQMIGGSGNHFDGIQVRGVDGLLVEDFVFVLEAPGVDDLHNAAIFIQEANGGSRGCIFRHGLVRSGGWQTFSLYAESVHLENITVMPKPRGVYVTADSWAFTQDSIQLEGGTPLVLTAGV